VHDDVMDASATRRGSPAAHAAFARLHTDSGWSGDAEVFGTAAAIVQGDLLLSWADAMFAAADLDEPARSATRHVYDDVRQIVMAGQYLDALVQARGAFSVADALRVATFKTSKYTVEGPLHVGAAAAAADQRTFDALSGYGLPLGEAFQLRDDVLGVFGDPAHTGKPAGDDLREGKRTLLVALAMERADTEQADLLRRELGHREMADTTIEQLRQVIIDTEALDRAERLIAARAEQARQALDDPAIDSDAIAPLGALALAATARTA
jgi:geranylgeranyl diphosphate synthase type I